SLEAVIQRNRPWQEARLSCTRAARDRGKCASLVFSIFSACLANSARHLSSRAWTVLIRGAPFLARFLQLRKCSEMSRIIRLPCLQYRVTHMWTMTGLYL